jgi:peroxiredoxin Q/BCP
VKPKDATTGCTAQARGFRDSRKDDDELGVVVFGASILDAKSKAKFAAKHGLDFPLLADEDHAVAEKYGVWAEKSMYGRKYWGVNRETFVIDPAGKIAAHWPKAAGSETYAPEVLAWLREHTTK